MSTDIFQTVAAALAGEYGIKVAIVYGSAAAGKMRPGSDVDVAVHQRDGGVDLAL